MLLPIKQTVISVYNKGNKRVLCFSDNINPELDFQTFPQVSCELDNVVPSSHCCFIDIKHSAGGFKRTNGALSMQTKILK